MHINMGYMDGTQENIMSVGHAQANQEILKQHVMHCMPEPDVLDLAGDIQQIQFGTLEFVKWNPQDETVWAKVCIDPSDVVTYTMQLTVVIHHKQTVAYDTVQAIVDAIYKNGAMVPCTLTLDEDREIPHTFLYPYHSSFSSLDHRICLGVSSSGQEEEENDDEI
jgi:hypothetical protein